MPAGEANARLMAPIPPRMRKTIQAAADLQGTKLNQLVVQAAYREAQGVLERETILRLNREEIQSAHLAEALQYRLKFMMG